MNNETLFAKPKTDIRFEDCSFIIALISPDMAK